MDWLKEKASAAASFVKEKTGLDDSPVLDSTQVPKSLGLPQEKPGVLVTGGRRYRKKTTKRHSKKRKTMRRKH